MLNRFHFQTAENLAGNQNCQAESMGGIGGQKCLFLFSKSTQIVYIRLGLLSSVPKTCLRNLQVICEN